MNLLIPKLCCAFMWLLCPVVLSGTHKRDARKGRFTYPTIRTLKNPAWGNMQSAVYITITQQWKTLQALKDCGRVFCERQLTITNWTGITKLFLSSQLLLTLSWHLSRALPFGNSRTMCAILKYLGFVSFCSHGEDLLKIPGLQNSSNNSKTKCWKHIF